MYRPSRRSFLVSSAAVLATASLGQRFAHAAQAAGLKLGIQLYSLRGFDLDVSTVNGDVWLKGSVASQAQKDLVLDVARRTSGVSRVIDAEGRQSKPSS